MKNKILLAVIAVLFIPFLSVYAEGRVYVYPTFYNGNHYAKDIATRIEYQGGLYHDSQKGVPTYSLSQATIDPVDYIVKFIPPTEYAYSIHGDCSGVVANGETKTCYVDYTVEIPEGYVAPQNYVEPVMVATPNPIPTPQVQNHYYIVPSSVPMFSGTQSMTDDTAQIVTLKNMIIELLKTLIELLKQQAAFQTSN